MRKIAEKKRASFYELFHASDDFFIVSSGYGWRSNLNEVRRAFLEGEYVLVHRFRRLRNENLEDRLEEIFYRSQNLERQWRRGLPCRSTSVGDIVRIGIDYWIVAPVGFDYGWQDPLTGTSVDH